MNTIKQGDCLDVLKEYPDNHFTSIVTDPPYGLSFMGKKWDYKVPSVEIWKECLRVLKPGGTMLCFAGSRTQHRMAVNVEDAGFIIKDCLMWIYGMGFPKSLNVGKKLGGEWEGYGTALKPAYEPILLAMKPNDGTYAANAIKHGVSGINVGASRVGNEKVVSTPTGSSGSVYAQDKWTKNNTIGERTENIVRFPANIILDEESGEMLDEQTGILKGDSINRKPRTSGKPISTFNLGSNHTFPECTRTENGGASRFFYCAKASKAERNKGCEGLEEKQTKGGGGTNNTEDDVCGKYGSIKAKAHNHHPTVKPLKLMQYLLKLVQPPKDGLLLDPFAGSGSTIVAAKSLGFNAIGIERCEEYSKIARARIAATQLPEKDLVDLVD